MPRSCCVPGCKSNYYSTDASGFRFPKDEKRREQWSLLIHREDFVPTDNTIICSKHFQSRFIITEDSITRPDGTVITARRSKPALTKDAVPTIFPNQSKYMTKEEPPPRTTPQERKDRLISQDELMFQDVMTEDKISNFSEFCEGFGEKLPRGWLFYSCGDNVSFLKVKCDIYPKVIVSFKVMSDLKVSIWHKNVALEQRKFKWLLGSKNT